jgi:hypothetical protein
MGLTWRPVGCILKEVFRCQRTMAATEQCSSMTPPKMKDENRKLSLACGSFVINSSVRLVLTHAHCDCSRKARPFPAPAFPVG